MRIDDFPANIQSLVLPKPSGQLKYRCLGCESVFGIEELLYICPHCGQVLLIFDEQFERLKKTPPSVWRQLFDYRRMLKLPALKGIYLYHEFIGSIIPLDDVVYLGEGHTPIVEANQQLQQQIGIKFFYKNDGQNPSASFKDRGMASAFSYINFLIKKGHVEDILAVCASTGDTSAAAALYAAYLQPAIKSAVLLPYKKVTPQQLSQPLGSGATVFEIPGVFDDCMKVVESLSEQYNVALLNSKNAWRILGQESYSYEIAQELEYELGDKVIVVPIGNAGNITAVMSGFIKFFQMGIIDALPKIIGVQSQHANPVYRYYCEPDAAKRVFKPIVVTPSVAQAAMIGNPVSMPRVIHLVNNYNQLAGASKVFFVEVSEQEIMDWQLIANRNGHIACTHGGETLAGLKIAVEQGIASDNETAIIDSTAHALKFSGFQDMYFQNNFPKEYGVKPDLKLVNHPYYVHPESVKRVPTPGKPLDGEDFTYFIAEVVSDIAGRLELKRRNQP